jgi:hypothetical protein
MSLTTQAIGCPYIGNFPGTGTIDVDTGVFSVSSPPWGFCSNGLSVTGTTRDQVHASQWNRGRSDRDLRPARDDGGGLQRSHSGPRWAADADHAETRARNESGWRTGTRKLHQPSFHRRLREDRGADVYRATVSDVQSRELDLKLLDF